MTACFVEKDAGAWLQAFRSRVASHRIPCTVNFELTHRCPMCCVHCYLAEADSDAEDLRVERDTQAVIASLRDWAVAGCLHVVITGGDPMMRDDFATIYRHAVEQGMHVTVMCSGTLVTDVILALFRDYPPRRVEISLYGATAPTHEAVTRVAGSHASAWQGIRKLTDAGIRVTLKTVVLTINEHEIGTMAEQAETLGCAFRFDAAIFPCLADKSRRPLGYRVAPETAVKWDMAFSDRRQQWVEALAKPAPMAGCGDPLYLCGAGETAFSCDPYGYLSPCLLASPYRINGNGKAFAAVWRDALGRIRQRKRTRDGGCMSGPLLYACTHCPAFNALETGDEEIDSPYMQQTAEVRLKAIKAYAATVADGIRKEG